MKEKQTDYFLNIKKHYLIRLTFLTLVILFLIYKGITIENEQSDRTFFIVFSLTSIIFVIVAVTIGFIYKKKRTETYRTGELKNRIEKFLFASRYLNSTLEASVIFTLIGFVFFSNIIFIIESLFFYLWLIYNFPTRHKILKEIELDEDRI